MKLTFGIEGNKVEYQTTELWNEEVWKKASEIYHTAFEKGAKTEKILRNMFKKEIAHLHVGYKGSKAVSMAITGTIKGYNTLLIDYLAVDSNFQDEGYGSAMVEYIKTKSRRFDSIIIEVESEETQESLSRIHFWEKCGFILTPYIHQYIWVPEPYQAMYLPLKEIELKTEGRELFRFITQYHKESFRS